MSSSSRVMASNHINTKIYYKNLYNQIKPIESICSVCYSRTNTIRMKTCSYTCLEKKINARVNIHMLAKKKKSTKFSLCIFKSFCGFR